MKNALAFFLLYFFIIVNQNFAQCPVSFSKWIDIDNAVVNKKIIIGDYNGDRISDFCFYDDNSWKIIFSGGKNLDNRNIFSGSSGLNDTSNIYTGDFNGDGVDDKVTSYDLIGKKGWAVSFCSRITSDSIYKFFDEKFFTNIVGNSNYELNCPGDINGDGIADIVFLDSNKVDVLLSTYALPTLDYKEGFKHQTWLNNIDSGIVKIIAGNFLTKDENGWDKGYEDLIIIIKLSAGYKLNLYKSNGTSFKFEKDYEIKDSNFDPKKILTGDFNGDGSTDIIYYFSTQNGQTECDLILSDGYGLNINKNCFGKIDLHIQKIWAGDFDGDGITDLLYLNNGIWVGLSPVPKDEDHLVGAGIYLAYRNDKWGTNSWEKRDPDKTPVVGWGDKDTAVGIYSSNDVNILRKQLRALKKAGIDFIISNNSDGLFKLNPVFGNWQSFQSKNGWPGDYACQSALDSLFKAAKLEKMKVAIMLGFEFWGPYSIPESWGKWDGWENQYLRIKNSVDAVKKYVEKYPDTYFKYRGKPLLLAYLDQGFYYPPGFYEGKIIPRWYIPEFTVRYNVGFASTYSVLADLPEKNGVDPPFAFYEGIDKQKFWGWGMGSYDKYDPSHLRLLPWNAECMSIFPGNNIWWYKTPQEDVKRQGGEFYLKSWEQVIEENPKMVILPEINNWNEEYGIEGCIGKYGWTDRHGNKNYDWYLKITKKYSYIYKNKLLPENEITWVREAGSKLLYQYIGDGKRILNNKKQIDILWETPDDQILKPKGYPVNEPDILLPFGWLEAKKYLMK
ncbi:MAG: hypothetical protein NTX22_03600 [Ignavibacteriales bacterium]|nr:hypothetical protein [Ignavibacteriales bacterium]